MKVVRALEHAVMNTQPCIRYLPDWHAKLIFYPVYLLPAWLADLIMSKIVCSSMLPAGVIN